MYCIILSGCNKNFSKVVDVANTFDKLNFSKFNLEFPDETALFKDDFYFTVKIDPDLWKNICWDQVYHCESNLTVAKFDDFEDVLDFMDNDLVAY